MEEEQKELPNVWLFDFDDTFTFSEHLGAFECKNKLYAMQGRAEGQCYGKYKFLDEDNQQSIMSINIDEDWIRIKGVASKAFLSDKMIKLRTASIGVFRDFVLDKIKRGDFVGFVSFADSTGFNELSPFIGGRPLIRRFLDMVFMEYKKDDCYVCFDEKGTEYSFLDDVSIVSWLPSVADRKYGKNSHIEQILKVVQLKQGSKEPIDPKRVTLFDDNPHNCLMASKKGYQSFEVDNHSANNLGKILTAILSQSSVKELSC